MLKSIKSALWILAISLLFVVDTPDLLSDLDTRWSIYMVCFVFIEYVMIASVVNDVSVRICRVLKLKKLSEVDSYLLGMVMNFGLKCVVLVLLYRLLTSTKVEELLINLRIDEILIVIASLLLLLVCENAVSIVQTLFTVESKGGKN